MKRIFSKAWKSSVQPRKQRKYTYNAPTHVKGDFLSAHLSKSLRSEFGKRSARIVKGDKVKIMRGKLAGTSGEVLKVDAKKGKIFIREASRKKVAGTEVQIPLEPSNVMIIEPETKDSKRLEALRRAKKGQKSKAESLDKKAAAEPARKEPAKAKAPKKE